MPRQGALAFLGDGSLTSTTSSIPTAILWARSVQGDVQDARDLADDAVKAFDLGDHAQARYSLILCGEKLDLATKKIVEALRG